MRWPTVSSEEASSDNNSTTANAVEGNTKQNSEQRMTGRSKRQRPDKEATADTATTTTDSSATPRSGSEEERRQRSRERNRIHARKTRLRKKQQLSTLEAKVTALKTEQIRLKQLVQTKTTANILLGLTAEVNSTQTSNDTGSTTNDNKVEELLQRSNEDIPDASQIPELPALILPGQHASKKLQQQKKSDISNTVRAWSTTSGTDSSNSNSNNNSNNNSNLVIMDGIDYDLLGKDRAQCTAQELDQIRRERNRMHAKRTRDRKRILTEAMAAMCRNLQDENQTLVGHLQHMDPEFVYAPPPELVRMMENTANSSDIMGPSSTTKSRTVLSPAPPTPSTILDLTVPENGSSNTPMARTLPISSSSSLSTIATTTTTRIPTSTGGAGSGSGDQLSTLLVAGTFLESHNVSDDEQQRPSAAKRLKLEQQRI